MPPDVSHGGGPLESIGGVQLRQGSAVIRSMVVEKCRPRCTLDFKAFERSWDITGALAQHEEFNKNRNAVLESYKDCHISRRALLRRARLDVEDVLDLAYNLTTTAAADVQAVQQMTANLHKAVREHIVIKGTRRVEEDTYTGALDQLIDGVQKSCQELSSLKQAIEDPALVIPPEPESSAPPPARLNDNGGALAQRFNYCSNCNVGGHGQRFASYLLKRPGWSTYPVQKWFVDDKGNDYFCPLGKKLVNFADETHFSRTAMYIKGRVWLEDKVKVYNLAPELQPKTYILQNGAWAGEQPPPDEECPELPWFVKETDRNWGTSIILCSRPSEVPAAVRPSEATFVVQQHVPRPKLLNGKKVHFKFYNLLVGYPDASWHLYTYTDGYLSVSPNMWSPADLSKETQVTIIRSDRSSGWHVWNESYPQCRAAVAKVIGRAVEQGKLEPRAQGKSQFEIFSADFLVDELGTPWFFEFNMSPVLKDPADSPTTNDGDMITGALSIVFPHDQGNQGLWELAAEFVSPASVAASAAGCVAKAGETDSVGAGAEDQVSDGAQGGATADSAQAA